MDQLKITKIFITKDHLSEIIAIAKQCAPNEACGIIAGEGSTIKKIYEISNSLQSPVEYLMDAAEMVEVFWEIEKKSWDTVAFFHSHPTSPAIPSLTDLQNNYYPDTPYLIVGCEEKIWTVRVFYLNRIDFQEIPLVII